MEMVDERETPPSRVWSKGGGGGVSTEGVFPPSRIWSEGGGGDVLTEEILPPSRVSSKGGGNDGRWGWLMRGKPLRLALGAREGVVAC